eukprot:EG_transcript_56407
MAHTGKLSVRKLKVAVGLPSPGIALRYAVLTRTPIQPPSEQSFLRPGEVPGPTLQGPGGPTGSLASPLAHFTCTYYAFHGGSALTSKKFRASVLCAENEDPLWVPTCPLLALGLSLGYQ